MSTHRDPGQVFWSDKSNRWWSVCASRFCQWKSSHEEPQAAIAAMHRHLITGHAVSEQPLDARNEPQ